MSIMEKLLVYFITLLLIISSNDVLAKKRVCIIGAGRVGLGVLKTVAEQSDKYEPVTFERNSDVGGLWIHREHPELDEHGLAAHSGIYDNLRTITSTWFITYEDYQTMTGTDHAGFVSHGTFLEYMRNYTNHFQLRKYIQLNTHVKKVMPLKDKCTHGTTRWSLEIQNLKTHKNDATICDAMIICSGRYSKPNIPNIPGINTFHGLKLHSRSYRKPQDFTGKTVIVLGAGASGLGISRDLSSHAKTVYLSYRQTYNIKSDGFPANVFVKPAVVKANGNQFTLSDNSKITADALIYCTGYVYDFPFLDANSGITYDNQHLYNLKQNLINKKYPSMAFIGLGDNDGFDSHYYYAETTYFLRSLEGKV